MQNLKSLINKKVIITQIKSDSKVGVRQKASLTGLGLRGIGSSVNINCSEPVLGMIKKINHLIKIS